MFTRTSHRSLSRAAWITFPPYNLISLRFISIFYSHPRLGFLSLLFSSLKVLNKISVRISYISHPLYMLRSFHPPWFDYPDNIWRRMKNNVLLIVHFSRASPLIPLRSRNSPNHPALKQSHSGNLQRNLEIRHHKFPSWLSWDNSVKYLTTGWATRVWWIWRG